MADINIISIILILGFIIPIVMGITEKLTRSRMHDAVLRLLANLEFLIAFLLAICLTKRIFLEQPNNLFRQIYTVIPETIRSILVGQELLTYLVAVPFFLIVIGFVLILICVPLHKLVIEPIIEHLYNLYVSRERFTQRLLGAIYRLPLALIVVFLLGLFLNFWAYYLPSPQLITWMTDSVPYQMVEQKAVAPALDSKWAKSIPVLLNDSFARARESFNPGYLEPDSSEVQARANHRVITYFNGVTLDEAIKSTPQIDQTARQIVGSEQNSKQKAYLLYKWVSRNVDYDYDKAVAISENANGIESGSIVAFETRKGICFDYSSLYISMCRAVGLQVRLVTGLAYSGTDWGDHAWNHVYLPAESRWINIDCTFGINGNYFDQRDFDFDHRYAQVQGEW